MDAPALEGFFLRSAVSSATDILMDDFCSWWRNLPSDMRKAKAKAWIAYRKARLKATASELEDGIIGYTRHKPKWQHFAHAATWLNQERWNDEVPALRSPHSWQDDCTHSPACQNATNCQILRDIAAYKASKSA